MTFYIVKNKIDGSKTLVEADVKTQAFRMVGEQFLVVEPAKPAEIVAMLEDGSRVMRRTDAQSQLPLEE